METVTIVGAGRAGGALAIALMRAGWAVERIVYRQRFPETLSEYFPARTFTAWEDLEAVNSDLLIVASGDPEISNVASTISQFPTLPDTVLHLSGSLDSSELKALAERGAETGSAHPLISISDPIMGAESFAGRYFCLEGSKRAVEIGKKLANSLGAEAFSIATEYKPLYHAAAVMASGHLTALIDTSFETLSKCGLTVDDARRVLFPLIASTISNLEGQSTAQALTGTFARGDTAALERHLKSMEGADLPNVREIYLALGQRSVELLKRAGINQGRVGDIELAISMAKENSQ